MTVNKIDLTCNINIEPFKAITKLFFEKMSFIFPIYKSENFSKWISF